MLIKIVSVSSEAKQSAKGTSYKAVTVVYRDQNNKINSKTINVFGAQKRTGEILSEATAGQFYEVTTVKNDAGYWDWTDARIADGQATSPVSPRQYEGAKPAASGSASSSGRGFETPEERAKKQVYIVRQSSLANAVATLSVGSKTAPKPEEVIAVARKYEQYVFDTELKVDTELPASAPSGSFSDLEDDVEF